MPATTTLDPLFDQSNFQFEGDNLSTFLTMITTDPTLVGAQFTSVVIEQLSTNSATVRFEVVPVGGVGNSVGMVLSKAPSTANWLFQGDQRVGASAINAIAQSSSISSGCNLGIKSGIWPEVDAPADPLVDYAIVKGPGLPLEGVLLFKGVTQNKFGLMPDGGTYDGVNTATVCNHNRYFMDDTHIAAIPDNSVYTIELFDDGGTLPGIAGDTLLHTYTSTLRKAPVLNASLSGANFAALTSNNLSSVAQSGGTLDVAWTLPAGIFMESVHVFRNLGLLGQDMDEFNVPATAMSLSKPLAAATGTVSILNSGINLNALDVFGREYATHP